MKARYMARTVVLCMACSGMGAEDPTKAVDIDGVHYTGVAWGPIKDGRAMMISDEGVRWIKLEDLPEKVARSYGLRGGSVNSSIPIKAGVPSTVSTTPPSTKSAGPPSGTNNAAPPSPALSATPSRLPEERGWKVARRWTGNGSQDTEPFSIVSPVWRIRWVTAPSSPPGPGAFFVRVCRPGDKTVVAYADGVPRGVTYCYASGEFYLGLLASSAYEVVAEEKAADAATPAIPGATPARGAPPVPGAAPAK